MLSVYIFFLAIVWTLATGRLDVLLNLCVFALGLYLILEDYRKALLISVLLISVLIGGFYREGFENQGEENEKELVPKPILKVTDEKEKKEETADLTMVDENGNKTSMKTDKKTNDISSKEKFISSNVHIDAGTNFLKAYESLKPDQIEGMRKDTAELVETQKVLMKTLTSMTPILENSQKMMTMFKGSFGEDFIKHAMTGSKK